MRATWLHILPQEDVCASRRSDLSSHRCAIVVARSDLFFWPLRDRCVQIMSFAAKVTALRRFLGVPETLEMLPAVAAMNAMMGVVGEGPVS